NIIIYGQTGAGKSSVINMIPGDPGNLAKVSNSARGVTDRATLYRKTIYGKTFNVWDTPGLNEGDEGGIEGKRAVEILHNLISSLANGVNLLVLVMRGPRINAFLPKNYDLLHNVICERKVPIALIVTGLDQEDDRRVWWDMNKGAFHQYGMYPQGHVCIS
ncbi:P-loop containing nucleoside triphosphate hydrolase protein, partial [Cyathus striatus]